ncbi:DUF1735 domain-containing protein [Puteibacter caeruleilacunae]|nr:DUF1735 domain-containing protein [Puteibacter caeruleilacunae]
MKKFYIMIMTAMLFATVSCDELADELFEKQVLFARNGLVEKDVELVDENSISMDVSVSISGTSVLAEDVSFTIEEFPDTLADLNKNLFDDDVEDYYTLLPDAAYSFSSYTGVVKVGDEYGLVPYTVDWTKLDMYQDYILPLKIKSTSNYNVAEANASTLLLNFQFKNSFSGSYSLNALKDGNSIQQGGIDVNALNVNSCYIELPLIGNEAQTFIVQVNSDNSVEVSSKNDSVVEIVMIDEGTLLDEVNVYKKTEGMTELDIAFKYKTADETDYKVFEGAFVSVDEED